MGGWVYRLIARGFDYNEVGLEGLSAYYAMEEGQGDILTDSLGNLGIALLGGRCAFINHIHV